MEFQTRLDSIFPNGCNAFIGEYEDQLQCPRPICSDANDPVYDIFIWRADGSNANTVVRLDTTKVSQANHGEVVLWKFTDGDRPVIMSSHLPPIVAKLLRDHRFAVPFEKFKLRD